MIDATFATAGNAIFTVKSGRTGEHMTFRIKRSDDGRVYFVGLLTGPDNTSHYTYIGLFDLKQGQLKLTRKSAYKADSKPVKVFNWAMSIVWWGGQEDLPAGYEIVHAGRCGRCGRTLTTPESVALGFGPICAEELGIDVPEPVAETDDEDDLAKLEAFAASNMTGI